MNKNLKQRFTYPLTGLLLLIAAGVGGFSYFNHIISKPVKIENVKIDKKAALRLNSLNQISKKNGITEWELSAATATLLKNQNKAILNEITVTFYTKDNKKITLTSKHGVLDTKSHDMDFSNNVIITYEGVVMLTDKLQYKKKTHIIRTNSHITLKQGSSSIEADSMTTMLNQNKTILKGHVKGLFNENFRIQ